MKLPVYEDPKDKHGVLMKAPSEPAVYAPLPRRAMEAEAPLVHEILMKGEFYTESRPCTGCYIGSLSEDGFEPFFPPRSTK